MLLSCSLKTTTTNCDTIMADNSDNGELDEGLLIYTADEILKIGLRFAGYKKRRIRRAKLLLVGNMCHDVTHQEGCKKLCGQKIQANVSYYNQIL
jgi:hypothetical protein